MRFMFRKRKNSRDMNIRNDRQALRVLGLLSQPKEKSKEVRLLKQRKVLSKCSSRDHKVRVMNVLHFSEEEILLAFQSKMAELRSRREDGLQDLHEAYQVR